MINPQLLEELSRGLRSMLPADARRLKEDVDHNLKALVRSTLEKMDLVSREELDRQTELLEHYRVKLNDLERRIGELESPAPGAPPPDPGPSD